MGGRGEVWAGAGEAPLLYLVGINQVLRCPGLAFSFPACLSLPGLSQSLELLWQLQRNPFP